MCNNENVIHNPTVQQLHDAFRDENCEVWYISANGDEKLSLGVMEINNAAIKTLYIKRKPKIVAKYGDFEFTEDELPQKSLENGERYYFDYTPDNNETDYCLWLNDEIDNERAENRNVFLTHDAAKKWHEMLLSFQNELLKGV